MWAKSFIIRRYLYLLFPWCYHHTCFHVHQILLHMLPNLEPYTVVHHIRETIQHAHHVAGHLLLTLLVQRGLVDIEAGLENLEHLHVERISKEVSSKFLLVLGRFLPWCWRCGSWSLIRVLLLLDRRQCRVLQGGERGFWGGLGINQYFEFGNKYYTLPPPSHSIKKKCIYLKKSEPLWYHILRSKSWINYWRRRFSFCFTNTANNIIISKCYISETVFFYNTDIVPGRVVYPPGHAGWWRAV